MAYTKTNWTGGTLITPARLRNLETQHEKAVVDARVASANPLKVHIVSSLPAGSAGQICLSSDNKLYGHNGTSWGLIGGID